MRDYLAILKSVCDHLALLGEPVSDATRISHILNGLTMEYESVMAIINATKQNFDLEVHRIILKSCAFMLNVLSNGLTIIIII